MLLAAFVTACSAGGGAGTGASPPPCPATADVGVPLAIRLPARPTVEPPPVCPLVQLQRGVRVSGVGGDAEGASRG